MKHHLSILLKDLEIFYNYYEKHCHYYAGGERNKVAVEVFLNKLFYSLENKFYSTI